MGLRRTKIKLYKGRLLAALFLTGNVWFAFAYQQGFAQKGFGASEPIILFIYIGVIWGAGALYDRQQKQKDILQHNHDRFRLIFEKSGVGIALMEPGGKIVFVNPKMTEMFGYKKEAFLNMTFRDFSHPKDVLPNNDLLDKLVSGEIEYYQLEKRYICEDGRTIWGKVTSSLMVDEDEQETLIIGVVVDITERKMMERKLKEANESLEKMSHTDSLTGLLNRRGIEKHLETEWENARKNGHFISFMIIDIDYFKYYNDHYGHLRGDSCLIKVAGVIQKTMEQSGACISRYGGEEFLIALPGCSPEEALLRAEALCQSIEEERIEHRNSPAAPWVTVSIGAAGLIPGASHSFTALFKQADQALYQAKQNGRNRVHTQLSSSNEAKLLRRHP